MQNTIALLRHNKNNSSGLKRQRNRAIGRIRHHDTRRALGIWQNANVTADLLLTAGVSSIVGSASGADNKYDSVVNLTPATAAGRRCCPGHSEPVAGRRPGKSPLAAPLASPDKSGSEQQHQHQEGDRRNCQYR